MTKLIKLGLSMTFLVLFLTANTNYVFGQTNTCNGLITVSVNGCQASFSMDPNFEFEGTIHFNLSPAPHYKK